MIEIVKIAMDQEDPWIDTTFGALRSQYKRHITSHHIIDNTG